MVIDWHLIGTPMGYETRFTSHAYKERLACIRHSLFPRHRNYHLVRHSMVSSNVRLALVGLCVLLAVSCSFVQGSEQVCVFRMSRPTQTHTRGRPSSPHALHKTCVLWESCTLSCLIA
jgi:hypothetical protein